MSCDLTGCLTCSNGFTVNPSNKLCTNCYSSCQTCTGIGTLLDHKCSNCKTNYVSQFGSNNCFVSTTIVPNYYYNSSENLFKNCKLNCMECSDSSNCINCSSGYYLNQSNNCAECYSSCGTCIAVGTELDQRCNTCKTNYFFKHNTSNCYLSGTTISSYFFDTQLSKYMQCPQVKLFYIYLYLSNNYRIAYPAIRVVV